MRFSFVNHYQLWLECQLSNSNADIISDFSFDTGLNVGLGQGDGAGDELDFTYQVKFSRKNKADGSQELISSYENIENIESLKLVLLELFKAYKIKLGLFAFIFKKLKILVVVPKGYKIFSAVTSVPETYSDRDIEIFIAQEHASMFPHAKGDLYFDFLVNKKEKTIGSHQKSIEVFSVEKKNCKNLIKLLSGLNIKPDFFGFDEVNFMPWRNRERIRRKNKLLFSALIGGLLSIGILVSWGSIRASQVSDLDFKLKKMENKISESNSLLVKALALKESLKEVAVEYQAKQHSKINLFNIVHLLKKIDSVRPLGVSLKKIILFDQEIIISGQAKDLLSVKNYERSLGDVGNDASCSQSFDSSHSGCAVISANIKSISSKQLNQSGSSRRGDFLPQDFKMGVSWLD